MQGDLQCFMMQAVLFVDRNAGAIAALSEEVVSQKQPCSLAFLGVTPQDSTDAVHDMQQQIDVGLCVLLVLCFCWP